jgi:hypothetical protein
VQLAELLTTAKATIDGLALRIRKEKEQRQFRVP